jgi:cytochrome oxidase Cu insertion factor (SCO1/SenC/PrrC family)
LLDRPAPPIQLNDVDGKPFDLAALKGKVVLLNFWASW